MSKLIARRQQDFAFASALIGAHLIDPEVLLVRLASVPAEHAVNRAAAEVWVHRHLR